MCYAELVRNVKGSAAMESWINTALKGYTIIKYFLYKQHTVLFLKVKGKGKAIPAEARRAPGG